MSYAVGSLVKARGREWVVLPESTDELLVLRPLGGTEDEVTGIYVPLETVHPAQFDLPSAAALGDHRSCKLLRDAVRLGFRSSAGPFRSFARISVEPRPYQLVPLLMALRQDPVRLLIADDVGIGKTIEAALIARELLDRAEAKRLAVLCPPHLAEQWQEELSSKFHIEAEVVLSSTAARLERGCGIGQSLFELYPYVIVSTDFIKSDRRRDEFLRLCPELVIVDEAHTCAFGDSGRGGKQQRYQLLKGLAADPNRHLILVTATPHSGKEDAFRSLLALLRPEFGAMPEGLDQKERDRQRKELAGYLVQRRRPDIRRYLETDTSFPKREDKEVAYVLGPEYRKLFERVLQYTRETVREEGIDERQQRVRWWSALALLRSLASSPAAAAATLGNRAGAAEAETVEQANDIGIRGVMDGAFDESVEGLDVVPGSDYEDVPDAPAKRRLKAMATEAEAISGAKDTKLASAMKHIADLLAEGYTPIVFCRYIPTAEYVAEALRARFKGVEVQAITGVLPPAERALRIRELAQHDKRILVATDCLSEGINLQDSFDAVFHYDLSWNPTRHEQREGRVDRFGQTSPKVRVVTYWGTDNQIDGLVLDVLIRKHKAIRNALGVSVPVPINTNQVMEAIFEGLLLREQSGKMHRSENQLSLFDELAPVSKEVDTAWRKAEEAEKRSRSLFAQDTIAGDEVALELKSVREAVGSGTDVEGFITQAVQALGGTVRKGPSSTILSLSELPIAAREAVGFPEKDLKVAFSVPAGSATLLDRTHPFVEGLACHVMDSSLDSLMPGVARRCGAVRTTKVTTRTTILLCRFRYHIITRTAAGETPLLAEDCQVMAFEGAPGSSTWLEPAVAEMLLSTQPSGNVSQEQAQSFVQKALDGMPALAPALNDAAVARGQQLLDAHRRVRHASRRTGVQYRVEPQLPPDILGVFVYLPAPQSTPQEGGR